MRVHSAIILAHLLVMAGARPAIAVDPDSSIGVYVMSTPDTSHFADLVASALTKGGGFWDPWRKRYREAPIIVVDSPKTAKYVLKLNPRLRDSKWHEGWLTPGRPTAKSPVFAYDRCGRIVWSKIKGNMVLGQPTDVQVAAERIAYSFRGAVYEKKSRMNRLVTSHPCLVAGDEFRP